MKKENQIIIMSIIILVVGWIQLSLLVYNSHINSEINQKSFGIIYKMEEYNGILSANMLGLEISSTLPLEQKVELLKRINFDRVIEILKDKDIKEEEIDKLKNISFIITPISYFFQVVLLSLIIFFDIILAYKNN